MVRIFILQKLGITIDKTKILNKFKNVLTTCILQVKSAEKCNDFLHSLAAHFLFYLVI